MKARPQYFDPEDFFQDMRDLYRLAQVKGVAPSPAEFVNRLFADMHNPGDTLGPELRAERVANGLCADCGRPIDKARSKRRCARCLDRNLKGHRDRAQRARCG